MNKLEELFSRYPALAVCESDIKAALDALIKAYRAGGKILLCGKYKRIRYKGVICEKCELLKGFLSHRKMTADKAEKFRASLGDSAEEYIEKLQGGIPAISLPSQAGVLTAYANDVDAEFMYAQLVNAYAKEGDVLIAISTSGNSANCVRAAETAKALGITSIALTGARESRLSKICDVALRVPET